LVSLIR
jgi:L6_bact: ribosomal protein L6